MGIFKNFRFSKQFYFIGAILALPIVAILLQFNGSNSVDLSDKEAVSAKPNVTRADVIVQTPQALNSATSSTNMVVNNDANASTPPVAIQSQAVPTQAPTGNPSKEAGIATGAIGGVPMVEISKRFAAISQMGFKWVRVDFVWNAIQPTNTQNYVWGKYDSIVQAAADNNLNVLGILDYSANWAKDPACIAPRQCAPRSVAEYSAYAKAVADRYKQKVNYWEVWNEQNSGALWSPGPNAAKYTDLLKQSYTSIKSANPNAFVLTGGMDGSSTNATKVDPVAYLKQMYAAGAKGYFDAVSYHPYTFPKTVFDTSTSWAKIEANSESLRSVMIANGDEAKKIWVSEYGAPTDGPRGSIFIGEVQQAQMVKDFYSTIQSKSWAGPYFWFTYQDAGSSKDNRENFFGIIRYDGGKKPAYNTWRQLLIK